MAAYASLVSVMHILDQIQLHPSPPISFNQEQLQSLSQNITFLQDFLQLYPHDSENSRRIYDAAHAVEDLIESHIVDRIRGGPTSNHEENNDDFYQDLQRVIKDMESIKKDAMEIKSNKDIPRQDSMIPVGSSRLPSSTREKTMVGFDDLLVEIMEKLVGQRSSRQIIPIIGMGGIGKTTLARNAYVNPLIVEYFDICAWITISQDHNVQKILSEVLVSSNKHENRGSLSGMSEEQLGENVYKYLSGRRYLIVMDDMWNVELWDKLKFFFPDNNNGSRIMITTRLSKLAFHLTGCNGFSVKLLDNDKSWILFSDKVFGDEICPPELLEAGKKIVNTCKGLPLSIVVIGGLLAKSEKTRQYWEYIANNLNPIVNLEDDRCCLKILSSSYINLPVHLKPCFLYMGIFPEDEEIRVSSLLQLWVVEGFLKPVKDKSLEEVARDYFNDLVDRNLILVHKWGSNGKVKVCKIHDLVRDLCLREAHKEKFFYIFKQNSDLRSVNTQRRIVVHHNNRLVQGLKSTSNARSLICDFEGHLPLLNCRLLRVLEDQDTTLYLKTSHECSIEDVFQLVNLRYLNIGSNLNLRFPSSMSLVWNLQILIVKGFHVPVVAPSEIWDMSQLRHVQLIEIYLPDPPNNEPVIILTNLKTLFSITNFVLNENVVKRIPNIKKLGVSYRYSTEDSCLKNLAHLHKLESFSCAFDSIKIPFLQTVDFPDSIGKLTLDGTRLDWDEMSIKIGSLPHLQVLKLRSQACEGYIWEPIEGQFCSLRILVIDECFDLVYWIADETNFPRLEKLVLEELHGLYEVPSRIGDISTLRLIELNFCSDSAVISVKKILDEQEELGNLDLQVQVSGWGNKMRAILIDWLVQVHQKFELSPETLYLTINILDRYLATKTTLRKELQLLGIGSMLIASKYEEIWVPEVNELVNISDRTYTNNQVLVMEKRILGELEWNLTVPTPYMFLVRFIKASMTDSNVENMAYFLAELGMMNYATFMYCPSMIAASAVYAARCTVNVGPVWNDTLKLHAGFSESQLMDCAKLLVSFHSMAAGQKLRGIYRKYSSSERGAVAFLPPAESLLAHLATN